MSELLSMMEKKVIDDMSGPKERVVIFAEGDANNVSFDNDGLPYVDNTSSMFPTSARDFAKANPQYEYKVVVGSGERQLNKAFQDVKSSGFMDDNTRLIVMGHASSGGQFGGVEPIKWSKIIRDNGLKDKFVVSIYVDGSNRMTERASALNELYMSGNESAEKALRVAYKNLDSQNVINEIDDPAQWKRALELEALRVYSESDEANFTGWDQLLGDY